VFYKSILLPAIMPQMIAPLRVSLALAFALSLAAEFMGAQRGIGVLMMVARRTLQTETILLGIIVVGVEAAFLDYLLRFAHRRLTRWSS
ncbi:MAG: ABC transporter permease subunit, partial [Chloroflexi bacterium]|nr:ABC transporter permease subunit [Chloroflexota bacterium]